MANTVCVDPDGWGLQGEETKHDVCFGVERSEWRQGSWPRMALECGGRELAVLATPHRVYADNLVAFELAAELQGDVLFRMMHMQVPLFRVQFNTTFLEMHEGVAEFPLSELDEQDEQPDIFERRFNPATKLRFFFDVNQ